MSTDNSLESRMSSSIFPRKYLSVSVLEECEKAVPPVNNMGGIIDDKNLIEDTLSIQVGNDRFSIVNTPNRNINSDPNAAFVDWLNFSFMVSSFYKEFPSVSAVSDDDKDVVIAISGKLKKIFGFGVTSKCQGGKNFYKHSYVLGDGWGFLCIGGFYQKGTCLIMLNGSGCTAMNDRDWCEPMFDF